MPPSKRANAAQNAHASCTSIVVGVTTLIVAHAHLSRVRRATHRASIVFLLLVVVVAQSLELSE